MSGVFKPKIPKQPARAPDAPALEAPQREIGGSNPTQQAQLRKRRGRGALRIDPQTGGVGSRNTGLNIPQK